MAASLQAMGEKTQAAIGSVLSRSSVGSGGGSSLNEYKDALSSKGAELASGAYQKGGELASGAYAKGAELASGSYQSASYAKHAALDWLTSLTASSTQGDKKEES